MLANDAPLALLQIEAGRVSSPNLTGQFLAAGGQITLTLALGQRTRATGCGGS